MHQAQSNEKLRVFYWLLSAVCLHLGDHNNYITGSNRIIEKFDRGKTLVDLIQ